MEKQQYSSDATSIIIFIYAALASTHISFLAITQRFNRMSHFQRLRHLIVDSIRVCVCVK